MNKLAIMSLSLVASALSAPAVAGEPRSLDEAMKRLVVPDVGPRGRQPWATLGMSATRRNAGAQQVPLVTLDTAANALREAVGAPRQSRVELYGLTNVRKPFTNAKRAWTSRTTVKRRGAPLLTPDGEFLMRVNTAKGSRVALVQAVKRGWAGFKGPRPVRALKR